MKKNVILLEESFKAEVVPPLGAIEQEFLRLASIERQLSAVTYISDNAESYKGYWANRAAFENQVRMFIYDNDFSTLKPVQLLTLMGWMANFKPMEPQFFFLRCAQLADSYEPENFSNG